MTNLHWDPRMFTGSPPGIHRARAARPALPVLMITGYAGEALVNIALPDGVEVLRKPFSLEELAERIRAMLAGRKRQL